MMNSFAGKVVVNRGGCNKILYTIYIYIYIPRFVNIYIYARTHKYDYYSPWTGSNSLTLCCCFCC